MHPSLTSAAITLQDRIVRGDTIATLVLAPDTAEDRHCDFSFLPRADVHFVTPGESRADIDALIAARGYDYVLNFTDWTDFSVVHLGAATTGGPFYSKSSLRTAGVRVPRTFAPDGEIRFPVIVKPDASCGSQGVARVHTHAALDAFCKAHAAEAGDDGFILEAFIDGPEFTVLVVENPRDPSRPSAHAIEFCFARDGDILDYETKWTTAGTHGTGARLRFLDPQSEHGPDIHQRLVDFVLPVFVRHRLPHYFRFDVRMDRHTRALYLLDINPYCGMFYPRHDFHAADVLVDRFMSHASLVRDLMLCDCRHILEASG